MYYFLNQYIFERNSGVEHAEIKRVQLFDAKSVPAKIVTRDFDRSQHRTIKQFGLTDDDLVNMFDYFQNAEFIDEADYKTLHIQDLHLPVDYQIEPGANVSHVRSGDHLVEDVWFTPGTIGQLYYVNFFDASGNLSQTDLYDWRGFKSAEQLYGQDGQLMAENLYTPTGKRVMERYYVKDTQGNPLNTLIKLITDQDVAHYFTSVEDLFTFFLDRLNRQTEETNTFIADRPGVANQPLLAMTTKARKYVFFPIAHATEPEDQLNAPLDGYYQVPLSMQGLAKLDGLITMTNRQRGDLEMRLKQPQMPIMTISGGVIPAEQAAKAPIMMAKRTSHKLLFVGRLGSEKRVDQLIRAFNLVHNGMPDATLELRGYGPSETIDELNALIKELNLTDAVSIPGYTADLNDIYDSAQVFVIASRIDAQPLAMIEALSHGLPIVSYDFNYGPNEIIEDGENGFLIENGNMFSMANSIIELFKDPNKLQKFSEQAYSSSSRFSEDTVWQQWQQIVQ
ncbi:accessory Sec system glycosyltransferase Asp1 [Loigolactobacillus iwatensis]|uniref:accessory Sec system glycosyltransferase Asp1 n=1 Tax=Loigolactobacillus iwatensis TaxID=1267156 RepID=UPI000F7F028C|nr:accessory Sec system glycosyltransferase Asp1 [Loigolactobacillus iwatensis]